MGRILDSTKVGEVLLVLICGGLLDVASPPLFSIFFAFPRSICVTNALLRPPRVLVFVKMTLSAEMSARFVLAV